MHKDLWLQTIGFESLASAAIDALRICPLRPDKSWVMHLEENLVDLHNRLAWKKWQPLPRIPDAAGLPRLQIEDCVVQVALAGALQQELEKAPDVFDRGLKEKMSYIFNKDINTACLCRDVLLSGACYALRPFEARAEKVLLNQKS